MPPIALGAAQLDAGAHDLEREARLAKFPSDGKSLDLCEIREIANAQATGRFVADIADKMCRRKIVAVEFLVVGTFLFCTCRRRYELT